MAIEALCPICGAVLSLRDDLQGKKVRCPKCEKVFTVGGEAKAREREDKQGVQTRAGAAPTRKGVRDDDEDDEDRPRKASSRRGREDDDEEEDDGRARTKKGKRVYHDDEDDDVGGKSKKLKEQVRRKGAGKGSTLPVKTFVIAGAALMGFLLICGGGGFVIYRLYSGASDEIERLANNPNNGVVVVDGNPLNLQPPKVNSLDDALRQLKSADARDRQEAANWLARTPPDAGRQRDAALALEPLLAEPDNNSRFAAMRALKTWAIADNVPALAKALDDQKLEGVPNDANKDAMAALGRLKDARGADAVARYMTNGFSREAAVDALRQIGPGAEKAVLKYYFHRDGGVREKAQVLAQGYGTRDTAIIAQAMEDMKPGAQRDTRREAARWLKAARVDPPQQQAVASALAAALVDTDNDVADAAMDALDTWATADTVPALTKLVEDPATGGRHDSMRRKAMTLLGKLKDVRGAEPVAARLLNNGDRKAAGDALVAMGPVARPAVEKYATNPNQAVRREVERVIASYGADTGGVKIAQYLADLASPEARRRGDAARQLEMMKVDAAQQPKVAKALETAAGDSSDRGVQELVLKALGVWGTKDNGPALVTIIEDRVKQPANARRMAMDLLGSKWKYEGAIKALALNIGPDKGDRDAAVKALIGMGPELGDKIEAAVAPGLRNTDKNIVLECVKVLGAVGTARVSAVELNKLELLAARQKQRDVVAACQKAIVEIAARGK